MANPNLKAKIEAAKSALEEGKNNPPSNQQPDDSNRRETGMKTAPDTGEPRPSTADAPTNLKLDATSLDARITHLENKLAENQRDLHTLLGKIRQVTRLQNDAANSAVPRHTNPKDIGSGEQNTRRHRGRKIAITLAVFTGVILGAGFFLASSFIDEFLAYLRTWTLPFVDFISDIVG